MNDIIESIIYAFVTTFGMYIVFKIVVRQEASKQEKDYFSYFKNLSEQELFGLWNEVCDEVGEPEDKVDLTNNKVENDDDESISWVLYSLEEKD